MQFFADKGFDVTKMTVLAFLNQKGGTGKTTLSLNVAYGLALTEQRVLLIDADQQASANA